MVLPRRQLLAMSGYWLGLSAIFAGLTAILGGRLEFTGLVGPGEAGRALLGTTVGGAIIAAIVQPTIGSISDYTTSRWGRRKPYILIGSILDVFFLVGIALSNDLLAIAAFISLLQFSSNFAQGPFQGYIPDLVPARQVGLASALVGMFQILGNVAGAAIGAIAIATKQFELGLVALGVFELATMVGVLVAVREGRTPKHRGGRSWLAIAREAWGTDILREPSFLWLVGSRLAILMAGGILVNLATFYFARSQGLSQEQTGGAILIVSGLLALCVVVSVIPAARLSDRIGRKKVIYGSCAIGVVGLGLVAAAPTLPVAYLGVALFGVSAGIFLAVDWALMTDIIPKASSGRYMGLSNVATASSGVLGLAFGGIIMDIVGGKAELGSGPRSALVLAAALLLVGALLLRPVNERRRDEIPLPDELAVSASSPA
ncbi:MAG TPA: MFS transporter [Candidatus Limnocylindrales bacterium]|jgi:MFS family permease|nr:MFS transporter [Candidatus Limnocylindrales bacterium]